MKKLAVLTLTIGAFGLAAMMPATSALADDHGYGDKAKAEKMAYKDKSKKDIVDTAAGDGQFSTLVAALEAAGLVDALKARGPFTVFAPTNAAFAALPEGTLQTLLKPENKAKLQSILTYHVVSGKIKSKKIADGTTEVPTLQGTMLTVSKTAEGVTVDGANVTAADIRTSNGIIHVIDAVVLPE